MATEPSPSLSPSTGRRPEDRMTQSDLTTETETAGYPTVSEEQTLRGGRWIAAEDVLAQAKALAIAVDGDEAPSRPRLIDAVGAACEELASLRAQLAAQAEALASGEMVSVNRQALTMILACLHEGADDPYWEQVYPTGDLFPAVNELTLNLEGKSDPIERQTLAGIAEESRVALGAQS